MKKLVVLFVTVIALFFSGCTVNSVKPADNNNGRIIVKEYRKIHGTFYYIIEVDGTEYLSQYSGGFVKLERD